NGLLPLVQTPGEGDLSSAERAGRRGGDHRHRVGVAAGRHRSVECASAGALSATQRLKRVFLSWYRSFIIGLRNGTGAPASHRSPGFAAVSRGTAEHPARERSSNRPAVLAAGGAQASALRQAIREDRLGSVAARAG